MKLSRFQRSRAGYALWVFISLLLVFSIPLEGALAAPQEIKTIYEEHLYEDIA